MDRSGQAADRGWMAGLQFIEMTNAYAGLILEPEFWSGS